MDIVRRYEVMCRGAKGAEGNTVMKDVVLERREAVDMLGTGYRSALDSIFCAVIILHGNGDVMYQNQSSLKLLRNLEIDMERLLCLVWEKIDLLQGAGFYQISCGQVHVNASVYPWCVEGKRLGSTLVLHESLNETCRLPELYHALSKLEDINTFLECSHDGILVVDDQGVVLRVNSALEKQLVRTRQELLGRNVADLVADGIYEESVSQKVIRSQKTEAVILHINGRQLLSTGTPVFSSPGRLTAVVTNVRDITELNELNRELEHQRMVTEGYVKTLRHMSDRHSASDYVACSREMQHIFETVLMIAEVDSTVLLTGESGTGKEVVVDLIYRSCSRSDKVIIKINCAAIPASLFESELFGYEDGAFTGARRKGKAGFFEMAHGGTLFLDEIGELPMELQVKLLRVIQEGELTRIGGANTVKVDVRLIAATNQNLWERVQEGTFRKDLYYRLNVINIEVPPLRQRRDDIVPLARHFLDRYNSRYRKRKMLSMELCKILRNLDWPGNVRELENLIENMVVLVQDDLLLPDDLPDRYRTESESDGVVVVRGVMPMREAVRQAKLQVIRNAGKKYGTVREIAQALEVDRSTISRKAGEILHK